MDSTYLLALLVAGAIGAVVFFLTRVFVGDGNTKIFDRLSAKQPTDSKAESIGRASAKSSFVPMLQRIGQAAAQPFMPKTREKQSTLRKQLGMAGIYAPSALKVVTGAKVILLCVGLGVGYAVGFSFGMTLMGISLGGLFGYLAPTIWLKSRIKGNQMSLRHGLPDALDLMVVCVESGLTVDASMQRVGTELSLAHPALSRELAIAHMETRVGLSRAEALKNLATRTGAPGLQSLSAMLIQADRFGTSIAQALRVHADTMRNERQAAAEELAAKASVKMSFPLVLFIFPATFLVLAGPTVIGLMNSPLFK
jgi:tight adherence protein C